VVIEAVCHSIAELTEAGIVDVSDRALMAAQKWTGSRTRARRITGNLAFLMMAHDLVWSPDGTLPRQGRAGRAQHWPLLLRLADSSAEWRQVVAGMWATSLISTDVGEIAAEVLDRWAETAEGDDERRHALVRMLTSTELSDRVQTRLQRIVKQWADPESSMHAPETAAAFRTCMQVTATTKMVVVQQRGALDGENIEPIDLV
jgi:hypothetical protein